MCWAYNLIPTDKSIWVPLGKFWESALQDSHLPSFLSTSNQSDWHTWSAKCIFSAIWKIFWDTCRMCGGNCRKKFPPAGPMGPEIHVFFIIKALLPKCVTLELSIFHHWSYCLPISKKCLGADRFGCSLAHGWSYTSMITSHGSAAICL